MQPVQTAGIEDCMHASEGWAQDAKVVVAGPMPLLEPALGTGKVVSRFAIF